MPVIHHEYLPVTPTILRDAAQVGPVHLSFLLSILICLVARKYHDLIHFVTLVNLRHKLPPDIPFDFCKLELELAVKNERHLLLTLLSDRIVERLNIIIKMLLECLLPFVVTKVELLFVKIFVRAVQNTFQHINYRNCGIGYVRVSDRFLSNYFCHYVLHAQKGFLQFVNFLIL